MNLNRKYKPLFRLKTRYCMITGGRGSGKSFALCTYLLCKTFKPNKTILFTRYTMTSAEISIIPEFWEKVELLGYESYFAKTKNSIINLCTGSTIIFRGLKTSSGKQTANLKSIPNLTTWVLDEAEEMHDEAMFDKIDLSVRKKGEQIEVILALNPPDHRQHFIFRRFFKGYGLSDVWNGVKDDCTFIHTTYLDNLNNLDESFLARAERFKEIDIEKYNNVFLGHFGTLASGLIYKNWESIKDDMFPDDVPFWYGADWGFSNDPTAIVRIAYKNEAIYLHEVFYKKEAFSNDYCSAIISDARNIRHLIYQDEEMKVSVNGGILDINGEKMPISTFLSNASHNMEGAAKWVKQLEMLWRVSNEIYCDPARPEQIADMRAFHSLEAYPAVNTDKSGRIDFLRYFKVYYTESSKNISEELWDYKWMPKKEDATQYENKPMDGNDHCMDAINYGAVTHLRRLGIRNSLGQE